MNVLLKCKTFCNNLHIFSTNLQSVNVKHPVEVVDFVLEDDCSEAFDRVADCPLRTLHQRVFNDDFLRSEHFLASVRH